MCGLFASSKKLYTNEIGKILQRLNSRGPDDIKIRSSYNLSAISFTPKELAAEIIKQIPEFTISYKPDFRQKIANSWPNSIDDSSAREDWNWNHSYDLEAIANEMLLQLREKAMS